MNLNFDNLMSKVNVLSSCLKYSEMEANTRYYNIHLSCRYIVHYYAKLSSFHYS